MGALAEPLACCIHGLEILCLQPQDILFVVGDGTMGLIQALLAKKMGVRKVILSGRVPERLALAREMARIFLQS
jgi:threonine dehydrogenase-like Zn-dependent dehydrogenase